MRKIVASLAVPLLWFSGCRSKEPKADFTTPEGAILKLEEAYRSKDIEAAVAAKDFVSEARVMLSRLNKGMDKDAEVLKETAEVLELSFRAEMKKSGFPDFTGLKSRFPSKEKLKDFEGIVAVTEVCTFPDGGTSRQKILVAKTAKGWRVLNPEE